MANPILEKAIKDALAETDQLSSVLDELSANVVIEDSWLKKALKGLSRLGSLVLGGISSAGLWATAEAAVLAVKPTLTGGPLIAATLKYIGGLVKIPTMIGGVIGCVGVALAVTLAGAAAAAAVWTSLDHHTKNNIKKSLQVAAEKTKLVKIRLESIAAGDRKEKTIRRLGHDAKILSNFLGNDKALNKHASIGLVEKPKAGLTANVAIVLNEIEK